MDFGPTHVAGNGGRGGTRTGIRNAGNVVRGDFTTAIRMGERPNPLIAVAWNDYQDWTTNVVHMSACPRLADTDVAPLAACTSRCQRGMECTQHGDAHRDCCSGLPYRSPPPCLFRLTLRGWTVRGGGGGSGGMTTQSAASSDGGVPLFGLVCSSHHAQAPVCRRRLLQKKSYKQGVWVRHSCRRRRCRQALPRRRQRSFRDRPI